MQVQFDARKVVPRPEDKIKGGFSEFFFFFFVNRQKSLANIKIFSESRLHKF